MSRRVSRAIVSLSTVFVVLLVPSSGEAELLLTVRGTTVEVDTVTFEPDNVLRVGRLGSERRFAFRELVGVTMQPTLGIRSVRPGLVLTSGATWSGSLRRLGVGEAVLRSPLLGEQSFPRSEVAVVVMGESQALPELLAAPPGIIVLRNGDRIEGRLREASAGVAVVDSELGKLDIGMDRVAYIKLADFPPAWGPAREAASAIVLADGSWLLGKITGETDGKVRVSLAAAGGDKSGVVDVPKSAISSVSFLGRGVVYLSDLEPAAVEEAPFFDYHMPWQRDLSVTEERLSIRNRLFRKGLGVHSRCRLTYDLEGGYALFRSVVGIDDAAMAKGNCVFEVWVDGERRWSSGPVAGRDAPRVAQVDVGGARQLVLLVEFGEAGDVADRADWADAFLVTREAFEASRPPQPAWSGPAEQTRSGTGEEAAP